jgi:hypothetical protein
MKGIGLSCILILVSFGYTQVPDTLWTRTYGGEDHDCGISIEQTSDSGYIMVGYTLSFGDNRQVYLIKTNAGGDVLWTRNFGDNMTGLSILCVSDSAYVISGSWYSDGWGDICLWKRDINGNHIWSKYYDIGDWEHGRDVQQTSDDGYIITGYANTEGTSRLFLLKTNSVGDSLWTRFLPQSSEGHSVRQTSDGGYIVTGSVWASPLFDILLVKTNANGDVLWTQNYGTSSGWDVGYDVLQTDDGGYIVVGQWGITNTLYDIFILKTDSMGNSLWTKTYGGSRRDIASCVRETPDGGYVLAGQTQPQSWSYDVWILKTTSNGDTLWTRTYGGAEMDDEAFGIDLTFDGGCIVVGRTQSFGAGGSDVWLLKMEPLLSTAEGGTGVVLHNRFATTIFSGPLQLPGGRKYKVFDITGRIVEPDKIAPGIYFVEIDNEIVEKVVKIR